jgi:hypothetical protein
MPIPDQSYSIAANDNSWLPSPDPRNPLTFQGSATASACHWALAKNAYFSALGTSNGVGNPPAAPGFTTTDKADPLKVKFHCSGGDHDNDLDDGGRWSLPVTINYNPQ